MFDSYIDSQNVAYSILKNSVINNKVSHAYLFESNSYNDVNNFVMSFVKFFVCKNNNSNFDNCNGCDICHRIDNNNYLEVKVIRPDGLSIKKEQLLELQEEFSYSGIEGDKRVYVIFDCDKMTAQAANSLLKFLEEPNVGIFAILVTNNINGVLSTIISRCQIIKLKKNNNYFSDNAMDNFFSLYGTDKDFFYSDDKYRSFIDTIIDFVSYYENNGIDSLLYTKKMWHSFFKDRSDNIMALDLLINFYYDILKVRCGCNNLFFNDYLDFINVVSGKNTFFNIIHKINVCIDVKELLKKNLNINLLIDNMIIKFGGV